MAYFDRFQEPDDDYYCQDVYTESCHDCDDKYKCDIWIEENQEEYEEWLKEQEELNNGN